MSEVSNEKSEMGEASPTGGDTPKDLSPSGPESAASLDSVEGKTHIAKPSGLKPPSKIGRPCTGQTKPAIPQTPKQSKLYCLLL